MEITFVTDESQMFNAIYLNGVLIVKDWEPLSAGYLLKVLARNQVINLEELEISDETFDKFWNNGVPENRKDLPQ